MIALPKKNVVLMGDGAFKHLLESVQAFIGSMNNNASFFEKNVKAEKARVAAGIQEAVSKLAKHRQTLQKHREYSRRTEKVLRNIAEGLVRRQPPRHWSCRLVTTHRRSRSSSQIHARRVRYQAGQARSSCRTLGVMWSASVRAHPSN